MLEIARDSFIVLGSITVVMVLLRVLFGVRVRFETEKSARRRQRAEQKHRREMYELEEGALEKVIAEETERIRRGLRRTLEQIESQTQEAVKTAIADELSAHTQAAKEVKAAALKSIEHSAGVFENQRQEIKNEVSQQVKRVREVMVKDIEDNFTDILKAYVTAVMRDELDVDEQIDSVLARLEADKQKILKGLSDELA